MAESILFGSETMVLIAGVGLVLLVATQLSFWIGGSLSRLLAERAQFRLNLQILRQKLETAKLDHSVAEGDNGWQGFRTFQVSKLVREAEDITSIYLTPQDRRPLPFFRPGQYLTFSMSFPDQSKPVVRCYSLSDAPNSEFYRCTVKKVAASGTESDSADGRVSSYVNHQLLEGELIQVKAPAGHFHIDLADDQPIVLLAGGIGVTPLFSMLASIVRFQPHRRVILFYGGKSSADFALQSEIDGLVARHRNLHAVKCFSAPTESDRVGVDFDVKGRVSIGLLKSTLPSNNFIYYLCGPGSFMSSLHQGLLEWGVPDQQIHSEAFGPASVACTKHRSVATSCDRPSCKIRFAKSAVEVEFDHALESILEAAEQIGVDISSGCRAGNCGSCEITVLKGKTQYLKETGIKPADGQALSCVSTPVGDVEIDA